ncbi:hypothetical protein BGZ60DRAFT_401781 [Tricladium varicosporioides]|nr:hypothetical protein BGZ60DRAFT_401781 [Hymenoscyphus varicosporioides]
MSTTVNNYQRVHSAPEHSRNTSGVEADDAIELRPASDIEAEVVNAFDIESFSDFSLSLKHPQKNIPDPSDTAQIRLLTSDVVRHEKKKTFFTRRFSGWRGGICLNATFAGVVFFINTIILIWATVKFEFTDGLAVVFSGDCGKAEALSLVAHLFINILSTVLLGASSYAMQVASSPSRADIDRAHREQKWLDIGVFSFRNFKWISKYRLTAYSLLLLSSIPLHFLYNSVISSSLATLKETAILYVTPQYLNNTAEYTAPFWDDAVMVKVRTQATQGQLKHIGIEECNKIITTILQSKYESVVFVQDSISYGNSTTLINAGYDGQDLEFSPMYKPSDCWASPSTAKCELFFNSTLMICIIIANIVKCAIMVIMVWRFTQPSLVTRGDAIASFLAIDDSTTVGLRGIEKRRGSKAQWVFRETMVYVPSQKRWYSAPSRLKWGFSITVCILFVATAAGMLALGLFDIGLNLNPGTVNADKVTSWSILSLGFNKPSLLATILINGDPVIVPQGQNPFRLVLLANTPQLVLSVGYLLINNLLTDMLGAWEWSKIGQTKTKLRTTSPQGQQRSTYFLQLPYTYAVLLMVIMTAMHYLLSASLFVVDIVTFKFGDNGYLIVDESGDGVQGWLLNFSPLAIIFVLCVSILLIALPIILSLFKLQPGIPMVGSSSAFISAACHPPPGEGDAGLLPVQWGVVNTTIDPKTGVGTCSISSGEVSAPIEGQLYR